MKKKLSLLLCFVLAVSTLCSLLPLTAAAEESAQPDTWAMVDGLGRTAPDQSEVGSVRPGKTVGMFYWPWHYDYAKKYPAYNLNVILNRYPDAVNDFYHPGWAGTAPGTVYFWDQPIFGYYSTYDKYVIREQAELLADAGVDVIIMDLSNGDFTWKDGYMTVYEVFQQAFDEGVNVPKITFLLNMAGAADTRTQLMEFYNDIYKPEKYKDLWFYWNGKPLIMASPSCLGSGAADTEAKNFFTFRAAWPAYTRPDTVLSNNLWGWLSIYPQTRFGLDSSGRPEQMAVGVAQNYSSHGLTAMNDPRGGVFGRSYAKGNYSYSYTIDGKTVTASASMTDSMFYGINFQQQWDYAIQQDPDFIFVTGWNEWVAGRWPNWEGTSNAFPDQFSPEYSRDIEPSAGVLKDYYYCQLVENIRRFKGAAAVQKADADAIIDIYAGYDQWKNIQPEYTHYINNTLTRNDAGYMGVLYKSDSLRNDFVSSKVAFDDNYVYFMVKTAEDISPYTDRNWMRLFLDTDPASTQESWEGFEYVINRTTPDSTKVTVERSRGGWDFEVIGKAEYYVNKNVLQIKVPRTMLGFGTKGNLPVFHFKWADNNCSNGNIMEFYKSGDCAPGSRFAFVFDPTGAAYAPAQITPAYRLELKNGITDPRITSGFLTNVSEKTAPDTLIPLFKNSEQVALIENSGSYVGTGSRVTLTVNGKVEDSAVVIVPGDLNGNGTVTSADYLRLKKALSGSVMLSAFEFRAGDLDRNGVLKSIDYLKIKKYLSGAASLF